MSEEKTELEKGIEKETAIEGLRKLIIGVGEEDNPLNIPIFVGALSETHRQIYKTAMVYNAYLTSQSQEKRGGTLEEGRDSKSLKVTFDNLALENFPDLKKEELIPLLLNYITFIYKYSNRLLLREDNTEIVNREGFVNTIPGKEGSRISTITPVKPSNDKTLSMRDRMRRNLRGGRGEPDTFNIILLNSLLLLRVEIPSASDLIRLINQIATTLQSYGSRFNITSIHLERAGISEILVDFILDRIKYHNVKDVADHHELKRYILSNDIDPIVMGLLCTTAPKGLSFRLYCVANKCEHSEVAIIDPTAMLIDIEEDMSEERRTVLYEVVNKGRKLSREELATLKPVYKDPEGKPLDLAVPIEGLGRLFIDIPTSEDYFDTYHAMRDRINPELRELAINFPNPKEYESKRSEWLSSLRGSEYLQWFSHIEYDPEPGKEGEVEVLYRKDDPRGFEQGLMDIFSDDEALYMAALQQVIRLIPRMTFSYVGIPNDTCTACKKQPDTINHELIKGFTPIDPVMNFFDHTRMMIGMKEQIEATIAEGLS